MVKGFMKKKFMGDVGGGSGEVWFGFKIVF